MFFFGSSYHWIIDHQTVKPSQKADGVIGSSLIYAITKVMNEWTHSTAVATGEHGDAVFIERVLKTRFVSLHVVGRHAPVTLDAVAPSHQAQRHCAPHITNTQRPGEQEDEKAEVFQKQNEIRS